MRISEREREGEHEDGGKVTVGKGRKEKEIRSKKSVPQICSDSES